MFVQTHVCIQQTVIDLLDRGFEVHVVADATSSRSQMDRILALQASALFLFYSRSPEGDSDPNVWTASVRICGNIRQIVADFAFEFQFLFCQVHFHKQNLCSVVIFVL